MVIDDLLLGKALGTRGTDVIRVQHLQHIGTGIAHQGTDADDHQRDDGQHQMVRLIHKLSPRAELVVVTAHQSEQVEPAELDGEDQLQQRGEEERRQRDTCQRNDRNGIVGAAVLLRCGDDAQRHRNDDLKEERNGAHHEGQPNAVVELLKHGNGVEPAFAELTADGGTQPGEITGNDVLIHVVHGFELGHPFLKALGTGLLRLLTCHILNVRSGQATHQCVDNESHKE